MYANLGPGHTAELDPPSSGGVDLLYSHEYVAKRMKERNLHSYTANNPIRRVDPFGLKEVETGVETCVGLQKGHWLWGWFPSHGFLAIDGKGYGRYEVELKCIGRAVILDNDLSVYPKKDPGEVTDDEYYSICGAFTVDDCCHDVQRFRQAIRDYIKKETANPGSYSAGQRDCFQFVDQAILHALEQSKTSKSPYCTTDEIKVLYEHYDLYMEPCVDLH